ncbi:NAD(P)-binding protein [Peniophora sp. CONT]|nr:NAD(P)-binding protein [Peniophora sp. CONT]
MPAIVSVLSQTFPGKPKWSVDEIPDLSGKIMLVTGGNAGIGRETVKVLLQRNAKVYLAARSESKATAAIEELEKETGKTAIFLKLDLSDLTAVRCAADEFLSKEPLLHVLFNSAGVMACPLDLYTAQGFDMQIGTNVIGHFFLTQCLLPALRAVKTQTGQKARVVTTSSSSQYVVNKFNYEFARDGPARDKSTPLDVYNVSKFGNVLFANELARRHGDILVSTSVNPGNLKTDLQRHLVGVQAKIVNSLLHPAPWGALSQLYAGTMPEGDKLNGKFLIPWARVGGTNKATQNEVEGKKFWSWLEEQTAAYRGTEQS